MNRVSLQPAMPQYAYLSIHRQVRAQEGRAWRGIQIMTRSQRQGLISAAQKPGRWWQCSCLHGWSKFNRICTWLDQVWQISEWDGSEQGHSRRQGAAYAGKLFRRRSGKQVRQMLIAFPGRCCWLESWSAHQTDPECTGETPRRIDLSVAELHPHTFSSNYSELNWPLFSTMKTKYENQSKGRRSVILLYLTQKITHAGSTMLSGRGQSTWCFTLISTANSWMHTIHYSHIIHDDCQNFLALSQLSYGDCYARCRSHKYGDKAIYW